MMTDTIFDQDFFTTLAEIYVKCSLNLLLSFVKLALFIDVIFRWLKPMPFFKIFSRLYFRTWFCCLFCRCSWTKRVWKSWDEVPFRQGRKYINGWIRIDRKTSCIQIWTSEYVMDHIPVWPKSHPIQDVMLQVWLRLPIKKKSI